MTGSARVVEGAKALVDVDILNVLLRRRDALSAHGGTESDGYNGVI